jgi:membrane associated rhomboid family serine protease
MAKSDLQKIGQSFAIAGAATASLWIVHLLLWWLAIPKANLGLLPRAVSGLPGILTSPFVHENFSHLFSNSGPIFFFLAGILYFYRVVALRSVVWIFLMTGIWVWVAARGVPTIGASGLVYGFGAFLFFSGVFRRDARSMALSLVIAFFYGGMVWGVLPGEQGVSWESHLFGALAGVVTAFFFRGIGVEPPKRYSWDHEPEDDSRDSQAVWNYQQNWPGAKHVIIPEGLPDEETPA